MATSKTTYKNFECNTYLSLKHFYESNNFKVFMYIYIYIFISIIYI